MDRWHLFGKKRSATILVNRTTARVAAEITQAAAARVLAERNNGYSNGDDNGDPGDNNRAWKGGGSIASSPYMIAAFEPPAPSKVVEKVQVRGGGGYLPPLPPSNKDEGKQSKDSKKKKKKIETIEGATAAGTANGAKKDGHSSKHSSKSENEATAAKTLSRADSRAALLKAKKKKKKAKEDKLILETADVMAPPPSMLVVGAGGLQKQTYETKVEHTFIYVSLFRALVQFLRVVSFSIISSSFIISHPLSHPFMDNFFLFVYLSYLLFVRFFIFIFIFFNYFSSNQQARADALRAAVLENPENADALLGASAQMPLNSEFIRDRCHNATAAGGGFTSPAQAAAFRMVAAAAASSPKGSTSSRNAAAAADFGSAEGDLSGTDL